jgi:hypothetical protein
MLRVVRCENFEVDRSLGQLRKGSVRVHLRGRFLDPLRDDPRFAELLRKMKLTPVSAATHPAADGAAV